MSQQMNSNKNFWDEVQFELLVVFGWLALGGLLFFALAFLAGKGGGSAGLAVTGMFLVLPVIFHAILITIWHWKSRYKGTHSKLWGALLMLEQAHLLLQTCAARQAQQGTLRSDGESSRMTVKHVGGHKEVVER